ncbi:hypothetical protein SYNPS1DRAFT_27198 [Syncephalis pseudoplumigaleata]|uniref:KxDL domain-containing protein n=1 Tax=Syncephalis pseudoplumigaleata TaxID=1712513 RepID=A0A4P9Z3L6_9FUNG|nr:hypothetical protein SYNPS1DRAFT_27198 [Syncephalis pseudoplumigaleata]|eukprot:RKP27143.1 hypothetical protein SYNPS1DRAFT_27198 [Syncephalis pseudoplumigaleata]
MADPSTTAAAAEAAPDRVLDESAVPEATPMRQQRTTDTARTATSQGTTPSVVVRMAGEGDQSVEADDSDGAASSHLMMNSRHSTYSSRPASSTYDGAAEGGTSLGRVLTAQLAGCMNEQTLADMVALQEATLDTATHTHDTLAAFNEFAEARYAELQKRLEQHMTFVLALRKDLDHVFRRLRALKDQCRQRHPEANQTVRALYPPATYLAEGDDDWEEHAEG